MNLQLIVTNSIGKIWLWELRYLVQLFSAAFGCHHLTDGLETSSWASDVDLPIQLEFDLGVPKTFDVIELREDLKLGQRIAVFHVQVEVDGVWQEFWYRLYSWS